MDDIKQVKTLALIGSTGSIGRQTLELVRSLPGQFKVIALAAGKNSPLLSQQIQEFKPKFVNWQKEARPPASDGCEFLPMEKIAALPEADIVAIATSGMSGLTPTLAAVKAGKTIALANKESLVAAGQIIDREKKLSGAQILPVDSEHSAIWQCLKGENNVLRLILTASGGPFVNYSSDQLAKVTRDQALKHPSWRMGEKITIDSATLMNKGLEIIEAHWLFNIPIERIEVIIHRQCIIHSMVEFVDGSTKAQISCPDMRLPILHALSYPERQPHPGLPVIDWKKMAALTFETPDTTAFPCLRIAVEAGKRGGTYPAVLCAADEAAVELFLTRQIGFNEIAGVVENTLEKHNNVSKPAIEDILAADAWARKTALNINTAVRANKN